MMRKSPGSERSETSCCRRMPRLVRAGELLAELQTERDLKLKAEERSTALQQRADRDAEVIARLRGERDELR